MEKVQTINFFQWLDEDEGEKDGRRDYRMKPEESCNLTLKICTLENKISICKMKIEQQKNNHKQELGKVNWKLSTHRLALIVMFLLLHWIIAMELYKHCNGIVITLAIIKDGNKHSIGIESLQWSCTTL
ncbi:unnamed protein product [Lactuca saligna]|uniref:Transmembrane protein n=1 Tax=Lactuca saligna TaxID=75948 RepID=A0AA36E5B2_LACSI|nr:unnamed protein product [Lactuca saligna]